MKETDSLAEFRAEIDQIDDAMHDLVMRRALVVQHIAKAKAMSAKQPSAPVFAMRPGREARILRRLLARHSGPLTVAAIVRMWREMISALTGMQGPIEMAVFGSAEPIAYWDVARAHFGSVTPAALCTSTAQVLGRVAEGAGVIGILPSPGGGDPAGDWWPALAHALPGNGVESSARIVARLPFVRWAGKQEPEAVVLARTDREETGNDHSYLLLFCHNEMSRGAIRRLLLDSGIEAEPVDTGKEDKRLMLFDAEGYITGDDPRLGRALAAPEQLIERIVIAGGYAVPVQMP